MKSLIIKKDDDKFSTIDKNDMLEVIGNHSHLNVIENKNQIHKDGTYLLINDEFNEYSLSLTCDKDIISVDGDNATFTAVLEHNGVVCEGKYITFHANDIEQSVKTDQNGIATFVYEPQGAGLINVIASFMLLQETYELYDYLFYDSGVTGSKNPNWNNTGNMLVETTNNGTTITTDGTTTGSYTENQIWLTGDFKVTVEVNTTDTVRLGFIVSTRSTKVQLSYDSLWEITRVNGVYTFMRSMNNGESWLEISSRDADVLTTEDCRFYFYIPVPSGSARSLTYKNLKIYSI